MKRNVLNSAHIYNLCVSILVVIIAVLLYICIHMFIEYKANIAKSDTTSEEDTALIVESTTEENTESYMVAAEDYDASRYTNNLTETQILHNQEVYKLLYQLQELASEYNHANNDKYKDDKFVDNDLLVAPANELSMQYIRKSYDKYTTDEWNLLCNDIDNDFIDYVNSKNDDIINLCKVEVLYDNTTSSSIDFPHMCASLNMLLGHAENISKLSSYETCDIGTWKGDCVQLATDIKKSNTKDTLTIAQNRIGDKSSMLNESDILADIDAYNICSLLNSGESDMVVTMENYYMSLSTKSRYKMFIDYRFSECTSKETLIEKIQSELLENTVITGLLYEKYDINIEDDRELLNNIGQAFGEYIWDNR